VLFLEKCKTVSYEQLTSLPCPHHSFELDRSSQYQHAYSLFHKVRHYQYVWHWGQYNMVKEKETHDMHTYQVMHNSLESSGMTRNLSFGVPSSTLDGKGGIRCNVILEVYHPIIPVFNSLDFSNCIRLTRKWSIINYKALDTIPIFNCI